MCRVAILYYSAAKCAFKGARGTIPLQTSSSSSGAPHPAPSRERRGVTDETMQLSRPTMARAHAVLCVALASLRLAAALLGSGSVEDGQAVIPWVISLGGQVTSSLAPLPSCMPKAAAAARAAYSPLRCPGQRKDGAEQGRRARHARHPGHQRGRGDRARARQPHDHSGDRERPLHPGARRLLTLAILIYSYVCSFTTAIIGLPGCDRHGTERDRKAGRRRSGKHRRSGSAGEPAAAGERAAAGALAPHAAGVVAGARALLAQPAAGRQHLARPHLFGRPAAPAPGRAPGAPAGAG